MDGSENEERRAGARLSTTSSGSSYYHLPVLGQPPVDTVVQLRLIEPSAAFVMVKLLLDFECPMIVYVFVAAAESSTWPEPEPIGRPVAEPSIAPPLGVHWV